MVIFHLRRKVKILPYYGTKWWCWFCNLTVWGTKLFSLPTILYCGHVKKLRQEFCFHLNFRGNTNYYLSTTDHSSETELITGLWTHYMLDVYLCLAASETLEVVFWINEHLCRSGNSLYIKHHFIIYCSCSVNNSSRLWRWNRQSWRKCTISKTPDWVMKF